MKENYLKEIKRMLFLSGVPLKESNNFIKKITQFSVGNKVSMFPEEPILTITKINEWPDKDNTYDLGTQDGKIDRKNIPGDKIKLIESKILKEEVDWDSIENNVEQETEGEKSLYTDSNGELPYELKVAMLAHNLDAESADLISAYSEYMQTTKGASKDNAETLFSKEKEFKLPGSIQDIERLLKGFRKTITWSPEGAKVHNLPAEFKQQDAKWLNKKDYNIIIQTKDGKLSSDGKAQLEFLARMVAGRPKGDDERILYEYQKKHLKNLYSGRAELILESYYSKFLPSILLNLFHKQHIDTQLEIIIEESLRHALEMLRSGFYDYAEKKFGNIGKWLIQVVKNKAIDILKTEFTDWKLDEAGLEEYLYSQTPPYKIKSKANPENVGGNYDQVLKGKNYWVYVYNEENNIRIDLRHDARIQGGKISPLSERFLVNPSIFYTGVPKSHISDVAGYEDVKRTKKEPTGNDEENVGFEDKYYSDLYSTLETVKLKQPDKEKILTIIGDFIHNSAEVKTTSAQKKELWKEFLYILIPKFVALKEVFSKSFKPVDSNTTFKIGETVTDEARYKKDIKGYSPQTEMKWVTVSHGVIPNELNKFNEKTIQSYLSKNAGSTMEQAIAELTNSKFLLDERTAKSLWNNFKTFLGADSVKTLKGRQIAAYYGDALLMNKPLDESLDKSIRKMIRTLFETYKF